MAPKKKTVKKRKKTAAKPGPKPKKIPPGCEMTNMSLRIPEALREELRNAAFWTRMTISAIAEVALQRELDLIKKKYNKGKKFKARLRDLKGGRPLGS